MLFQRANSLDATIKMPPLARNLVDSNAMAVVTAFINSLPGTPALAPPGLAPAGGLFSGPVKITVTAPDNNAAVYYTLDGSLPTTNSLLYTGAFYLTNSAVLSANAFEPGFNNSVATTGTYTILPLSFTSFGGFSNGTFEVQLSGAANQKYILEASDDLKSWVSVATNAPASSPFYMADPQATNYPYRFYRVMLAP